MIAKQDDLRTSGVLKGALPWWNRILKFFTGHGHQSWRSAIAIVVVFWLAFSVVLVAKADNAFIPVGDKASELQPIGSVSGIYKSGSGEIVSASRCTNLYPCLSALIYPVDASLPVINLHQADFWAFNTREYEWILVAQCVCRPDIPRVALHIAAGGRARRIDQGESATVAMGVRPLGMGREGVRRTVRVGFDGFGPSEQVDGCRWHGWRSSPSAIPDGCRRSTGSVCDGSSLNSEPANWLEPRVPNTSDVSRGRSVPGAGVEPAHPFG